MIISAYLYNGLFSNVAVGQFFLDLQQTAVVIEYNISSFHTATFSLPLNAKITQGQKIKIQEQKNNITQTLFIGYIYEITPILDRSNSILQIKCYSEKSYLSKRLVINPHTINSLDGIIDAIQIDYNSNGDGWTGDVDTLAIQSDLTFGSSYYDTINNICDGKDLNRDVFNGEIKIRSIIGVDRTYGVNFQEIVFAENQSNISGIEVQTQYNDTNVIIAKNPNQNTSIIYPSPLPSVIYGVEYKEFKEYDLSNACSEYLKTISSTTYKVQIEQGAVNSMVGDRLRLRISGFGSYDFTGSVFVTKKTIQFTNGVKIENIEVSETTAVKKSFDNTLRTIQADLKRLQTG